MQNTEASSETPNLPPAGFGQFAVPEMPAYIDRYSDRGTTFIGETQPVYTQTRFGNPRYKGGLDAYVSQLEDPTYFDALKQKRGDPGVYEALRWAPGQDWRGGFGIASLDAQKNAMLFTRGGEMRKGGPKRSDIVEREGYWFEATKPGIAISRMPQNNANFPGIYEDKRRTPAIQRETDPFILREMIEKNPFHIVSHSAKNAKQRYDREFPPANMDVSTPGYDSGIPLSINTNKEQTIPNSDAPHFVANPW